ncbi:hypothetical protein MRX96_009053 [Rhipicephalus microplus]
MALGPPSRCAVTAFRAAVAAAAPSARTKRYDRSDESAGQKGRASGAPATVERLVRPREIRVRHCSATSFSPHTLDTTPHTSPLCGPASHRTHHASSTGNRLGVTADITTAGALERHSKFPLGAFPETVCRRSLARTLLFGAARRTCLTFTDRSIRDADRFCQFLGVLLVSALRTAKKSFCTMTAIPVGLFSSALFSTHAAAPPFYLCAFCKLICHGSGLRAEFCKYLCKVHEMWQCSHTHNNTFTVGSLCFFASEMKYAHDRRLQRSQPLSKSAKDVRKLLMKRRSESVESSYDGEHCTCAYSMLYTFSLGGSCNPTTWRKDVAIPKLKSYGISYYNPQVTQWIPELIELENQAKENAKVMMFVIDNQTRSVASMIESAHIAGTRRKLILILTEQSPPGSLVLGEPISEKEYRDLQQGRNYLRDLVEMHGIPVFHSMPEALEVTNRCLKEDLWPQDIRGCQDLVQVPHLALGDKYL